MTDGTTDRPRVGVLGYGSILSTDELDGLLSPERAVPVRVEGFRRVFNQEASWRDIDGDERAVLNVVPDDDAWCNAVAFPDVSRAEFREYRERERGYTLVEARPDDLTPYREDDVDAVDALDLALVATGDKVSDEIDPIPAYVDICLAGAEEWGERFYRDFLETTEVRGGETLADHLDDA